MEHFDEVSGGARAVSAAAAHGVSTMFTLTGAHVFPLYDGAVRAEPPMRLLDVRHEQTAVFAAEAMGKLTRTPGLAVLTAGPGVTNGISAITQAHFSGSPLVVLGGRAASFSWGRGALQELDHPRLLGPVTKRAATVGSVDEIADEVDEAFHLAAAPHRGPVFLDIPMDELFGDAEGAPVEASAPLPQQPTSGDVDAVAGLVARAERPLLVLGTDVWSDGAEESALRLVEELGLPTLTNGMGRGILPGGHPLLVGRARRTAVGECDLAVVVGTPLDFRLAYGQFGGLGGADAQVVHIADSLGQVSSHAEPAASASGDLTLVLDALLAAVTARGHADWTAWTDRLAEEAAGRASRDRELLTSAVSPAHPARIYGELLPRLAEDAVVIGDGGDFVSWAGRFVEPQRPGGWLDPGPFGCLGAGLGAAIAARVARPSSQVVLLLGDGASGLSLMDVDTLVRHDLPVVIVMGNNSAWGLEKQPMQMLYGYDVAADLATRTRYDQVVTALGGAGELVTDPAQIGPALDRAFAAGVPYLVNIVTDPQIPYPRSTTGM
ncbi:acetolactate synthase [Janibacter terrae]|uniref:acetolactate synthase n=1 Tax=Janibacter terrae TaxID=103817 RepID=UPI0008393D8D|nr:acetolactate synthase [Janibacter terrae]